MAARRHSQRDNNIWPGFVDALSTLLLAIIFLLVVFMLAQFFLSEALTGRDQALARLNRQVDELAELLSLERQANAELRLSVAQLSASLQDSTRTRDELSVRVELLTAGVAETTRRAKRAEAELAEAQQLIAADKQTIELQLAELASLRQDIAALRQIRAELEESLKETQRTVTADKETIEIQLRELVSLKRDIDTLRQVRQELEAEVARATELVRARDQELTSERDRSRQLEARLASEAERTALAQTAIAERDIRLAALLDQAASAKREAENQRLLSEQARDRVNLLNLQIAELREQLRRIELALATSEATSREHKIIIADLGRRLNLALASKVEELSKFRSEFFGRLREVLGDRRDITIVGDRFVFQSEVLFDSGSAALGIGGQSQLTAFANTLLEISEKIPPELPWILRVDGHTDRAPIFTAQFPSNWELSTARAISVTRFLISRGVPESRIAATGFAEYQPLDQRDDEIAYRRNRRIELKLTER